MAISTSNGSTTPTALGSVLGAITAGTSTLSGGNAGGGLSTTPTGAPPPGTPSSMSFLGGQPVANTPPPAPMQVPMAPPVNPNIQYDTSGFNKFNNVTIAQALAGHTPPNTVNLPVIHGAFQSRRSQPIAPERTAPIMPFINPRARTLQNFRAPFLRDDRYGMAPQELLQPRLSPRPISFGGY